MPAPDASLGTPTRLRLVTATWIEYGRVVTRFRRMSLSDLVRSLEEAPRRRRLAALEPHRLGRLVHRILNLGPFRPRCLTMALVLFRLLVRQGTSAHLIIGLPPEPTDPDAHAWVEVDGRDVGPPPGRMGHVEVARYGGRPPGA